MQEPWFLTRNGNCTHPSDGSAPARWGCDQRAQQRYLLDTLHRDVVANSGLTRAAFEASVDYAFVRGSSCNPDWSHGRCACWARCRAASLRTTRMHPCCADVCPAVPGLVQAPADVVTGIWRELPWLKVVVPCASQSRKRCRPSCTWEVGA